MRLPISLALALVCLAAPTLTACSDDVSSSADTASEPKVDAAARRGAAHTPAQRRAVEAQLPGGASRADVTTAEVAELFELRAGVRLAVERRSQALSALTVPTTDADGAPASDRYLERFGAFTIYVAQGGRRLIDLGPLGDLVPRAMPDRHGIVWRGDRDPLGETLYTAHAFYADGSVMAAWLGGEQRGTDASFRRLDKLLRALD